jgi:hypothetical protein
MPIPDEKPNFFRSRAFRECAVVFFVVGLIGVIMLVMIVSPSDYIRKSRRIHCISNLKQINLSLMVFAGDNNDQYPMQISTNQGGTKEWVGSKEVYRHFLVVRNELGSPTVLACPSDPRRDAAKTFSSLSNSNLSYWIELNALAKSSSTIRFGDCNLETNGTTLPNGCFQIATQKVLNWDGSTHRKAGNIGLSDGSVRQLGNAAFNHARLQQEIPTNWFAIP